MFPKAPQTEPQERRGINAVAQVATTLGIVWRETSRADVGIDGNLEHVDAEGYATGRTVAVQVKSGPSFFRYHDQTAWHFYPEAKHRLYWERYPLPVLLVIHDPSTARSYWTDVRQALRSPASSDQAFIAVPKTSILQAVATTQLFESYGVTDDPFIPDLNDVLHAMLERRTGNAGFDLSFFTLFVHGLTNICRSVYFGMDLALTAAEASLAEADSDFGVGVGPYEHEFLFDYIKFLVAQHLADVDFADCMIDWVDREMQPHFVAPLTSRGRRLVRTIQERERALVENGQLPAEDRIHVAQEGFFAMVPQSYFRRIPLIAEFERIAH
jgi:hypothetical protein